MQRCSPQAVFQEARTWVGTPYAHQHRLKGGGVDCVGLILGVGIALDIMDWSLERWAPFSKYSRTPNPAKMRDGMATFLTEIPKGAPTLGRIVWMQWRDGLPMHLGIIGELDGRPTLIHAYQGVDKCTEHGFEDPWPGSVESVWKYPGMDE